MASGVVKTTGDMAGLSITGETSRTDEATAGVNTSLSAASTGTLSTRTDDDTGVVAAATGHGISTSDKVAVYWTESGVTGMRYGMTATVSGDNITVDGGSGDNLPTQDNAVTIHKEETYAVAFDGDDMSMVAARCDAWGHVRFETSVPATLKAVELEAGRVWHWADSGEETRPITGTAVAQVTASQSGSSGTANLKVKALLNAAS